MLKVTMQKAPGLSEQESRITNVRSHPDYIGRIRKLGELMMQQNDIVQALTDELVVLTTKGIYIPNNI